MMNTQPQKRISVAVVFYNPTDEEMKQTKQNIEKLMSLTAFQFRFFLIDNGSPVQKLDPSIFSDVQNVVNFINLEQNQGFGSGHNSVLSRLDSQYHLVMNPDIKIADLTGFVQAINYLDHHEQVALLSPLVRDIKTGEVQYLNRKLPTVFDLLIRFLGPRFFTNRQREFTKQAHGYDHVQQEENATGSLMVLRTAAFKQVHGFDPRFFMYFEDTDLTVRLAQIGQVVIYPDFMVYHGWKRANHSLKGMMPMIQSMVKYFNKWGWQWYWLRLGVALLMRIVVSDYAATPTSGGTYSILEDFYNDVLQNDLGNEWIFILAGRYFPTSDNVKIVIREDLKKSKFKKLLFELGTGRRFINRYRPDVFISLQNISTVGVKSKIKITYLHQSIPFYREHRFSFFKSQERKVAMYQRLVGKVIKYSLSKEQPVTIVQTEWMKKAVVQQTRLSPARVLKVSPKVPFIDDGKYYANQRHAFFFPATAYVYKNHRLILDAIQELKRQGYDDFTVSLTLTPQQLPDAHNNVELLGFIPRQQVLKMYEDHVLIFPSYIESYGLPMLEAAQKADLILAADIPITHEVLAGYSNVYYFDYRDPAALAELMRKVLVGDLQSDLQPIKLTYQNESVLQTVQQVIKKKSGE